MVVARYTQRQRLEAVGLLEELGGDCSAVLARLGYPSCRQTLWRWRRRWLRDRAEGRDALARGAGRPGYSYERRCEAVACWLACGRDYARAVARLGWPSEARLRVWVRRSGAACLASGGVRVPDWRGDEQGRREEEPVDGEHGHGVDEGECEALRGRLERLRSEVEEMQGLRQRLEDDVRGLRAERHELDVDLEIMRYTKELLGKGAGADPDNLTNAERTDLTLHLADVFAQPAERFLTRVGLARSTFYYHKAAGAFVPRRDEIKAMVADVFEHSRRRYGYRRVRIELARRGVAVSGTTVRQAMRELGITPVLRSRRRYSSYSGEHTPAPANLVARNFHAEAPNRLWVTDITEFHVKAGKVYLSPVIDCFDGMPVAWSIGTRPDAALADTMLERACASLRAGEHPVIHSDRGCHYRWPGWIRICERHGLTRSMSAKGCSPDNAAAEGFFGRLKQEFYHNRDHQDDSIDEFIDDLEAYMAWYRDERIKTQYGTSIRRHRQKLGLMA